MDVIDNTFSPDTISSYEYWARVDRIVDGDTLDLTISLGFDIEVRHRVRLLGIDCPEIFSQKKGSAERKAGEAARDFLRELIPEMSWVEVRVFTASTREKYGRWLAEVFQNGANINQLLVTEGHAISLSV